ncbi:MAG: PIG-L family deacetylase [Candidatus Coatesbacteria bacterium]
MARRVLAVGAHPDDIEFMMAGTLILLGKAGYELHCLVVGNGSCGTATLSADEIAAVRLKETRAAAGVIGAAHHGPFAPDIAIFYEPGILAKVGSVIRDVAPEIVLTHGPDEYMEDHQNTCRLAITGAFCRGMRNFPVDPPFPPVEGPVAVYHALPLGLKGPLNRPVAPDFLVDVSSVTWEKREMLACHKSQKEWLDVSQGMDSYLDSMEAMGRAAGKLSGRFVSAEGWIRHLHQGLSPEGFDPLVQALGPGSISG